MNKDVGDVWRTEATFTDAAGALTNTTVVVTLRKPDGTTSAPSAGSPVSTGLYRVDTVVDQSGSWVIHYAGSGAATDNGEQMVRVRRKMVTSP